MHLEVDGSLPHLMQADGVKASALLHAKPQRPKPPRPVETPAATPVPVPGAELPKS